MGTVTRGFMEAFAANSVPVSGVISFDAVTNDLDELEAHAGGWNAKHGVLTAMPNQLGRMAGTDHERRWALVAPNSDQIGSQLESYLLSNATDLIAPSRWAHRQLHRIFSGSQLRIHYAAHGVSRSLSPHAGAIASARKDFDDGAFRVIHLSSTAYSRKSTCELIRGFAMAKKRGKIPDRSSLTVVLDHHAIQPVLFSMIDMNIRDSHIHLCGRMDLSSSTFSESLGFFHCVAQPSRGEGFGLIPLEARACGVPVLMTDCTGHSDHYDPLGSTLVPSGEMAPMDDLPGSMAPTVTVQDIADSLGEAWDTFPGKSLELESFDRKAWLWENTMRDLCEELKR